MVLEEKVAIITGAGSGIGRGIALALAEEEVRIVVCGRRKDKLDETVSLVQAQGGEAAAYAVDVSQDDEVDALVRSTLAHFGRIDILINNAGIYAGDRIEKLEIADWDQVMAINLRGPFLMIRAVLPTMRSQKEGHIINISSESGQNYYQDDGAYGTSKHALNALSEYTQRENQSHNIRVNTICPGMVVTEMTEHDSGLNHERCLYPEDIADLTLWLLTRRANIKIGAPILIQTMLNPWEVLMKLATLCYIRKDGKTLMIHRVKKDGDIHAGKWNGLGGKLEAGETPEECAVREIREESGLVARSIEMKGFLAFPGFANDEDWYAFVFVVPDFDGQIGESQEGYLQWIENAKIPDLNLWEGDRIFLPWLDQPGFFSGKFVYKNGQLVEHSVNIYD